MALQNFPVSNWVLHFSGQLKASYLSFTFPMKFLLCVRPCFHCLYLYWKSRSSELLLFCSIRGSCLPWAWLRIHALPFHKCIIPVQLPTWQCPWSGLSLASVTGCLKPEARAPWSSLLSCLQWVSEKNSKSIGIPQVTHMAAASHTFKAGTWWMYVCVSVGGGGSLPLIIHLLSLYIVPE